MRLLPPIAVGLSLAGFAANSESSDCSDPTNQCVPVVGCVLGEPNEVFFGQVEGIQSGVFVVKSSKGASCLGTFRRTNFGTAKVAAKCDDGRTGKATFAYYHRATGTGRGKGRMSDGERIIFWAGDRLFSYFENSRSSEPDQLIACGKSALGFSE